MSGALSVPTAKRPMSSSLPSHRERALFAASTAKSTTVVSSGQREICLQPKSIVYLFGSTPLNSASFSVERKNEVKLRPIDENPNVFCFMMTPTTTK